MQPSSLTRAEKRKGTIVVLVWLLLALVARDSWATSPTAGSQPGPPPKGKSLSRK